MQLFLLLPLLACKGSETPSADVQTKPAVEAPAAAPAQPASLEGKTPVTTASGLTYAILAEGSGETAAPGDRVTMAYTGWLTDGKKFDSSYDSGRPFTFKLGTGMVIPGWDEGVAGMKVGEKRQLKIPGELGYGARGAPPDIPPNATLIFDVELKEVKKGTAIPKAPAATEGKTPVTTKSGLTYTILAEGSGATAAKGDTVEMNYTGWLTDGKMFDSSLKRDKTFRFQLGAGMVIPGWDEGIAGMKVGEKRQLKIPGDLAYGPSGRPPVIPPDATLIFDVELVAVPGK